MDYGLKASSCDPINQYQSPFIPASNNLKAPPCFEFKNRMSPMHGGFKLTSSNSFHIQHLRLNSEHPDIVPMKFT